jgi:uncharacterized protein (DUF885 family)
MDEKTRRWILAGTAAAIAVVLCLLSYAVYRTVWGMPFTFDQLLLRQAVIEAFDSPQTLTQYGVTDGKWYDFTSGKLDDYSPEARQRRFERTYRFQAELAQWDRASLSPQDRLSYDIVRWSYARRVAEAQYPWLGENGALYPVNQAFGIQIALPNFLMSTHQIQNGMLARRYVSRLWAMGPVLDAVGRDVERQAHMGVIAPDFVIDESVGEMRALIAPPPGDNPLVRHLAMRTFAIHMDPQERDHVINDAVQALTWGVYPAYRRLIAVELKLRPRATHDAGVWRLPGGDTYYADQLKTLTSTDMTPDEIHAYGLAEVARISAEMDAELRSIGLVDGPIGERMDVMMADPRFLYANDDPGRAAMLERYRELLGYVKLLLPKYFAHVPAILLEVRRVPPFAELGAPGAYYERPSLDGARPGIFFANLRNTEETPMWAMPTLAYHEGIPGHHLQIATALEIADLPLQRRTAVLPAYTEGWALYAEHLAKDMGLYDNDPFGDLGRLQAELFRAVRLVVDTGIHAEHWSREDAIAYMEDNTGMAPSDVTAEVDRYVVWPGQACAYKIGMKTIMDLREQAKQALGPRFDLKSFHSAILDEGAMPLWLLQRHVAHWIAEKEGLRPLSP